MQASGPGGGTLACTICSEPFDSSSDCVVLRGCKHAFHNCVISWLRDNHTCPMCRRPAEPESAERIFFSAVELEQAQASGSTSVPLSDNSLSRLMKAMDIGEREKAAALEKLRLANTRNEALVRELEKLKAGKAAAKQQTAPLQQQQQQQSTVSGKQHPLRRLVQESDEIGTTLGDLF